ncbi:dolichol-phosphate mannosyltransferase, variant [Capsaspora owczarzaki ATCC 30864]|nr:dolichol-phosphate mannosyltransferase, variant [Capsaspora owczarzaki ATCC 30864]
MVLILFVVITSFTSPRGMDDFRDMHKPTERRISIIVPTYKEAENLPPLAERVFAACAKSNLDAELIVVDDNSQDGSVEAVETLAKTYNMRIVVREHERGLSSAVLRGFQEAEHPVLVVMDADLSHPPESLAELVEPIIQGVSDFTIGSRYADGGSIKDWPLLRRLISAGATMLARPLVSVSDPMSGFIALRRRMWLGAQNVNPMGFKIGLELMIKSHAQRIQEIPISFTDRVRGQSKLKLKTQVQYVLHLMSLYWYVYPMLFTGTVLATLGICVLVARAIVRRSRRGFFGGSSVLPQYRTAHPAGAHSQFGNGSNDRYHVDAHSFGLPSKSGFGELR